MNVLFVTWDGPQTDYLQSLFLPIFAGLSDRNLRFHVLQFSWTERGETGRAVQRRDACSAVGVSYRYHRVLRRPVGPGSLVTAMFGASIIRRAVQEHSIDVLMPRATLPALACMLSYRKKGPRMIFDADGLPLDERVDFSGWSSQGWQYRFLRDVEAQAVRRADAVIVRAQAAIEILQARAGARTDVGKFFVAPNGCDAKRFEIHKLEPRSSVRAALGVETDAPLLAYAGSTGIQYCFPEMRAIFDRVLVSRPDSRFLMLSGTPDHAKRSFENNNADNSALAMRARAGSVPGYLAAADVGIALRRRCFSMRAVSPVKIGEYLFSGLPVVATCGAGDIDQLPVSDAMYRMRDLEPDNINDAAQWIVNHVLPRRGQLSDVARAFGQSHFSLTRTIEGYAMALEHAMATR